MELEVFALRSHLVPHPAPDPIDSEGFEKGE
jgi:hypothetical protein